MDVKQELERLRARSFSFAGVTLSFFSSLLLALSALAVLLVLSIHFGWSGIAALIFAVAGSAAALLCFFFDSVKAAFGKGRTVGLGVLTLYLHLMAILGFAAPDFMAGLGITRWVAMTIAFFAITWGGSYALVSFEKASKAVSVLIVIITVFSFIPGNSLVRGINYLGQNMLRKFDRLVYDTAAKLDDPESAIRQKYLDEYREKVEELEKAWKRKEISAVQYEKRRRAIDREYASYINNGASGAVPEQRQGGGGSIRIVGALVTDDLTGNGFSGKSALFAPGLRPLYYYVKYRGGIPEDSSFAVRWYRNGELIREKSLILEHEAGEILDSCSYDFAKGSYDVRLSSGDAEKNRVTFQVAEEQLLRIDNAGLVPAIVKPGDVLTATVDYFLQGSVGTEGVLVREKRVIQRNGRTVLKPIIKDVSRLPGHNSSSAQVYLPSTIRPGDYNVITSVTWGDKEAKASTGFSVARPETPPQVPASYPSGTPRGKNDMTLEQLESVLRKVYKE